MAAKAYTFLLPADLTCQLSFFGWGHQKFSPSMELPTAKVRAVPVEALCGCFEGGCDLCGLDRDRDMMKTQQNQI